MTYYTHAARLLAAGWAPPEAVARPILQREALLSALGELAPHVRDEDAIAAAVRLGDREGIIAAASGHAIAVWCDGQLQVGSSLIADWSGQLLNALSAAIAADPGGVLDSFDGVEDPAGDAGTIRTEALGYIEASKYLFNARGQHRPAPALERGYETIPRNLQPLPPPAAPAPAFEVSEEEAAV